MESLYTYTIFLVLLGLVAVPYWVRVAKKKRIAMQQYAKDMKAGFLRPVTLHPQIDVSSCIGCGSCVQVCPENVLALAGGTVSIVSGMRCVGHGLCAEICPVGAITLGFGTPKEGEEIPVYSDDYQTNVPGLYVVGELGGMGLIRNAVGQAKKAVAHIAAHRKNSGSTDLDVIIVGAGPAGLTSALACQEATLRYVCLEQGTVGGTVAHYPRQKLVLTSPLELPLFGELKVSEISKEELLGVWEGIVKKHKPDIRTGTAVTDVALQDGAFRVTAGDSSWSAGSVILALGRRGTPRKLDVPGEDLPKVSYRLIEAESYQQKRILVVGGGDSAVEAAVALARQRGNSVSISYRRGEFVRLKEKNDKNIRDLVRSRKITAYFSSQVSSIEAHAVRLTLEDGSTSTIENDFVFIFAGGTPPTGLLKKAGVDFRMGTPAHPQGP